MLRSDPAQLGRVSKHACSLMQRILAQPLRSPTYTLFDWYHRTRL